MWALERDGLVVQVPAQLALKVVIRCRNFKASYSFYSKVLGLGVVEKWEEAGG